MHSRIPPLRRNPEAAINSLGDTLTPMVSVGSAVRMVLCKLETLRLAAMAAGDRQLALQAECAGIMLTKGKR